MMDLVAVCDGISDSGLLETFQGGEYHPDIDGHDEALVKAGPASVTNIEGLSGGRCRPVRLREHNTRKCAVHNVAVPGALNKFLAPALQLAPLYEHILSSSPRRNDRAADFQGTQCTARLTAR
jgi:hypothetical protein